MNWFKKKKMYNYQESQKKKRKMVFPYDTFFREEIHQIPKNEQYYYNAKF